MCKSFGTRMLRLLFWFLALTGSWGNWTTAPVANPSFTFHSTFWNDGWALIWLWQDHYVAHLARHAQICIKVDKIQQLLNNRS